MGISGAVCAGPLGSCSITFSSIFMLNCANPLPLGRGELEQWGEINKKYIPPSLLKIIQLNFPEPLNRGRWKQAAVGLGSL